MRTEITESSLEKVVRTACHGCHSVCGVLVHVKDGRVTKIEGDPEHPHSRGMKCPKGLAFAQLIYHPDRLKYPMKRIGERGEGKWQRISWDEALDTIADRLAGIKEKYGPLSIAASTGGNTRRSLQALYGLMHSLGCPNVSWTDAHYCWGPFPVAEMFTYGGLLATEARVDARNSNCLVMWGANPVYTYPILGRDVIRAKARGARLIVVDPRLTPLAAKADIWLQIRPGTDAALALGMLNVIINERLYDKDFVEKWCSGFDELGERVQEYLPEKVAEITWLAADDIVRAARMYATTRPAALFSSVANEMQMNSVQTIRAVASLVAITGNIDVEGGNVFERFPHGFLPAFFFLRRAYRPPAEMEEKRLGAKEFPLLCGPRSPFGVYHPPTLLKALLTDEPYPIKAWLIVNNPLLCLPNSRDVYRALKRVDFSVVIELFMTPTAEQADIVLPAASWLEKDEVSDLANVITARNKAIEPVGECWDEMKITFEILKRMGIKFSMLPVESPEEYNDFRLAKLGMTFEDLKREHAIVSPHEYKKYERNGFRTPSGKVELYSSVFKEFGYDPLPHYIEPPESPVSTPEIAKEYPFILITGARNLAYYHSMGRQLPRLRKLAPDPQIQLHPETASELGIEDGDWVWLEIPHSEGRIKQRAKLTGGIHPKVVNCDAHWWFPEKPGPDYGHWEVNINALIPGDPPYDSIAGTTPLRGRLCKIYRAE